MKLSLGLPYQFSFNIALQKSGWRATLCILDRAEQRRVEFKLTMVNTAFSKDIMKDRATISFNISDIFNSSKGDQIIYLVWVLQWISMEKEAI
jgi:hypothetical protein